MGCNVGVALNYETLYVKFVVLCPLMAWRLCTMMTAYDITNALGQSSALDNFLQVYLF